MIRRAAWKSDQSETELSRQCLLTFRASPRVAWAVRANSGLVMAPGGHPFRALPKGTPDILGMLQGGRAMFFEVKKPGQKPRDYQLEFLAHRAAQGALAGWGTTVNDVIHFLSSSHTGEPWAPHGQA